MTLSRFFFLAIACVAAYQGYHRWSSAKASSGQDAAETAAIQIYTTHNCGVCAQAKAYMNERNIAYRERDVEDDVDVRREFYDKGGRGVPWIWIGSERMEGFDADRFEELRRRAGLT